MRKLELAEANEQGVVQSDIYIYEVTGHYKKNSGEEKGLFSFSIESCRTLQVYDFSLLLINLSGKLADERGLMPNPNEIVITKLELLNSTTEKLEAEYEYLSTAELLEALPQHLHVARNDNAEHHDRWRIYNMASNKYIDPGQATVRSLLVSTLQRIDSQEALKEVGL